jgi:PAS domain S-box-containing protein
MAERDPKEVLEKLAGGESPVSPAHAASPDLAGAEATLNDLANLFFQNYSPDAAGAETPAESLTVEGRFRALVEQIPAVVFMAYLDKGIGEAYVSPQIEATLGYSQEEWLEDPLRWYAHVHPDDKQRWSAEAAEMFLSGRPLKSQYRVIARDGRVLWFQCEAKMVRRDDGRPWFIHGVGFDITELKTAQEKLLHDAFHDSLTHLPNRALFVDRLERAIARAKRHKDYKFAVLFVDLDRFKLVNDSLGHAAGDQLLIEVAQRILNSLRLEDLVSRQATPPPPGWTTKDDTLARLGGDEFTLLLDDIRDPTDSIRVAQRIQQAFARPFTLEGQEVFVTASIGIAASSETYFNSADVLRDADIAMYRAKAEGKARSEVFDQAMHQQAVGRMKLETDLRRALEREEFRVHYQPIVSLVTGEIAGFEALVRWQRPGVGLVLPGEFIGVAEEMGLIVPLGLWIMRKAFEQVHRWHLERPGKKLLTMSSNISGPQLMQPTIVDDIAQILRETQVEPSAIKLEITETVTMGDAERTIKIVNALKGLGIRLSIDDFGTGYSSLSYLRRFPMDTLKIDRSFIHDLATNPENFEIVRTIMGLARNLGMDVVAEGAETRDEIDLLKEVACDYSQGFYFSRAVDSERATVLLNEKQSLDSPPRPAAREKVPSHK